MTSRIKLLVAADMLFLLLLACSGSTTGILSEVLYVLAFLAPVGMMLDYIYKPKENAHGPASPTKRDMMMELKNDLSLSGETVSLTLPLIFPVILLILSVSLLTTLALGALGEENQLTVNSNFAIALLTHALAPALLEELLFRFAPVKLFWDNKKTALVLSSLMFAFAHANLFQIPYAIVAGIIFSALYIVTGSILPSFIIHFLNNTISLLSICGLVADNIIMLSLSALALISVIVIFVRRRAYIDALKQAFGGEKLVFSYHPLIFIATSLVLAISALFA